MANASPFDPRKPRISMRIRCAVCDKPVDRIDWWDDHYGYQQCIKVFCHGDTDQMALTPEFIASLSPEEFRRLQASEGVAFAKARLPEPPSVLPLAERGEPEVAAAGVSVRGEEG